MKKATSQIRDQMIIAEHEQTALEFERLRGLTDRERGEMILSACRSAAMIHAGRLKSGLLPATPDPWPASTWEFLRKHAPNAKRT
jgi:hypothetical protein